MGLFRRVIKWGSRSMLLYLFASYAIAYIWGGSHALPSTLQDKTHTDFTISFMQWVPRAWTARTLVEAPFMILGSKDHPTALGKNGTRGPKPVSREGEWQISVVQVKQGLPFYLPYVAFGACGYHWRIGTRWDDVDHYYIVFSVARRKLQNQGEVYMEEVLKGFYVDPTGGIYQVIGTASRVDAKIGKDLHTIVVFHALGAPDMLLYLPEEEFLSVVPNEHGGFKSRFEYQEYHPGKA